MRIFTLFLACLSFSIATKAQPGEEPKDTSWKTNYRSSFSKINDLVHTKLDVRFDYDKSYLYGKEWLTLKPHFYATDSVTLDAKGMDIKKVALVTAKGMTELKYQYDNQQLQIKLGKSFNNNEKYTLYFEYTSKPDELDAEGSAAITDAKGLYFINPKGEEKNKPTQIWTQGETESNSAWMITIDKPNQKTTEEIYMTVPDKYVTLSNGLMISQKKNTDGTRTDYWKMDQPHAPYLFFMGVGDFAIVKDSYKGKEVSYYVEKKYQPYARGIFGNTPEMMGFFSRILGVEFPWAKYAQMVGRDYVSGAMENTTATLHQESAYQNARELSDGNEWEETIAHELFHQWFGDLVTCESWSNLTVNESFANYSEYLWDEYKYGKDHADAHHFEDMQGYLMSNSSKKDLVRFFYNSKEDMFDAVSYNKGGRILNMLRNFVGDSAFFKSLNLYLTTNKFKTGEAHQLRLAFEEITGQDLNWFWNQWYYGSGHPKLRISYGFDSSSSTASVYISQSQKSIKPYILPMAIDIYENGKKTRHQVTMLNAADTFNFKVAVLPEWISVDADRMLLAERTDVKSALNYQAQWRYGKRYIDRKESMDYFAKNNMSEIKEGLKDSYYKLRVNAIQKLSTSSLSEDTSVVAAIEKIAGNDPNRKVKAAAILFLGRKADPKYKSLFAKAVMDSSYGVAGAALRAMISIEPEQSYDLAKKFAGDAKGTLGEEVMKVLFSKGTENDFDFIATYYGDKPLSQEKINMTEKFAVYLSRLEDLGKVKKGIDMIVTFRNAIPEQFRSFVDAGFRKALKTISIAKGKEIEDYVNSVFK
jgi:aminopeptidase N